MTSAAAERETRALESASETLLSRLTDIQTAITGLIAKVDTDPHLNWHSFMDSYALVTGQINSLLKTVKHERTPILKKYITLPILLSLDKDEELAKITQQRVPIFSHDVAPLYLRTKPDPEVEAKYSAFETRATNLAPDSLAKMMSVLEKVTQSTLRKINSEKEEIESRSGARNDFEKTTLHEDTMELMSAITYGTNLRPMMPTASSNVTNSSPAVAASGGSAPAKMPSAIKTNIRAANQVHPYQRN